MGAAGTRPAGPDFEQTVASHGGNLKGPLGVTAQIKNPNHADGLLRFR